MSILKKLSSTRYGVTTLILCVFAFCFARIHMRVETTLIGYKLGELKQLEMKELEKRSQLQMMLSKLNSKDHLEFISSVKQVNHQSKRLAMIENEK